MTIYYIAYATLCLIALIMQHETKDNKRRSGVICSVGFMIFFIILALRHCYMGVDLGCTYTGISMNGGYIDSFERLNKYSWGEILTMKEFLNYERGYIIFNKLVGSIYNNRQFFLGVCAFINMLVTAVFIHKRTKLPLMAWMVFLGLPVFLMPFSGLRQAIAISITMISAQWIEKKKIVPFALAVLLASMFHYTAFIFLLAYPMYYVKLTELQKTVFAMLIPVIYIIKAPLYMIVGRLFKDNVAVVDTGAGMLFFVFFLIYMFLIVSNSYQRKDQNGYINLFYVACVCQAFGGVSQGAMRVGFYFMPYLAVVLPNTIYDFKNMDTSTSKRDFMLSYTLIFIAFLLFGLHSISNGSWARSNPHVFFWQTVPI